MSLIGGSALNIEDLDVTMKIVTYNDPISHAIFKYKGKTSKRRFNNIMKMRYKNSYAQLKAILDKHNE